MCLRPAWVVRGAVGQVDEGGVTRRDGDAPVVGRRDRPVPPPVEDGCPVGKGPPAVYGSMILKVGWMMISLWPASCVAGVSHIV